MSSEFIRHPARSISDPLSGYGALRNASQMSETDAARFHKVSLRSIQNFIRGRRSAPEGVITEIGDLVRRMHHAADALSRTLTPETEGTLQFSTADNAAAQALGWPCAATYAAVVGMALASAPRPFLQAALDSSTFGG